MIQREELIQGSNLSFKYADSDEWTLKNVNFSVRKGEWVAIVGQNGSGKSTLVKFLNGLLTPQYGSVCVEGMKTSDERSLWEIRKRVGIVFQNPDNQFVATTVEDDVAFALENFGVNKDSIQQRVDESLRKVNMTAFLKKEPHRLSGGQKQRVAIAGILALKPSILILDEATSMLDPMGRKEVIETIHDLNKRDNMTIISITHDLSEAMYADRVVVMDHGQMVLEGSPKDVFTVDNNLHKFGLELPYVLKLRQHLIELGLPLSEGCLSEEELVDELWRLKSKA